MLLDLIITRRKGLGFLTVRDCEEGKQRMSTSILNVHNNPVNFAFLYLTKTAKTLLFSNFFYICYIHSKTRSLFHAEIILADFCVKLKYYLFLELYERSANTGILIRGICKVPVAVGILSFCSFMNPDYEREGICCFPYFVAK